MKEGGLFTGLGIDTQVVVSTFELVKSHALCQASIRDKYLNIVAIIPIPGAKKAFTCCFDISMEISKDIAR